MQSQKIKNKKNKLLTGFTIIELLVVIAIIAALASIILNNISDYKAKAKDAVIKVSTGTILINGSIYYENHGNYGGFCNNDITLNVYNSINSENKNCKANANSWVVCARLNIPLDGSKAWCVDNTGDKEQINDNQCNNSLSSCP